MFESLSILGLALIGLIVLMVMWGASRYKRCPSDKVLVIYGKTGGGSAKCVAGGAAFVWPVIQDYAYLDLTPISIDVDLKRALSKQNIRVDVPSQYTVGISNDDGVMINAAERLLGLPMDQIRGLAYNIIVGQMRLVIATMDIEEINVDRDKFLTNVSTNVGMELRKIGLSLINVNVTDIRDESGYIEALGKEAAAQAVNEAKVSVAQKNRDGAIGQAQAEQDQRVQVAAAEASAKVGEASAAAKAVEGDNVAKITVANSNAELREKEADANAKAVEGENLAKKLIAQSDAELREKQAEAEKLAVSAEKIQRAKALESAYAAEKEAEDARAKRDLATKEADIIVQAEIEKRKKEIEAEAEAEQLRRRAKGEADAIFLKQEAEARGLYEVLKKQADGFQELVKSAGDNPRDAVLLLIADQLPELVKTQVEAIKNIKIDKITVWEGGNGSDGDGNSTSKFVSGLYKSVPPLTDLLNMAGLELPDYLAKKAENSTNDNNIEDAETIETKE